MRLLAGDCHQKGLIRLMDFHRHRPSLLFLWLLAAAPVFAHDPVTTKLTWSREISRILAARCVACHQGGGVAPFALTTYQEVRPWAVAIRDETASRRMPPWNAVHGFGRFAGDPSLTQQEIQLIADWVNGGAPEGDPIHLDPALPRLYSPPKPPPSYTSPAADLAPIPAGQLQGLLVHAIPGSAEVRLLLESPSGELTPLAWFQRRSTHAPAYYPFLEPVTVPPGSRLRLWMTSPQTAPPRLDLLLAPASSLR